MSTRRRLLQAWIGVTLFTASDSAQEAAVETNGSVSLPEMRFGQIYFSVDPSQCDMSSWSKFVAKRLMMAKPMLQVASLYSVDDMRDNSKKRKIYNDAYAPSAPVDTMGESETLEYSDSRAHGVATRLYNISLDKGELSRSFPLLNGEDDHMFSRAKNFVQQKLKLLGDAVIKVVPPNERQNLEGSTGFTSSRNSARVAIPPSPLDFQTALGHVYKYYREETPPEEPTKKTGVYEKLRTMLLGREASVSFSETDVLPLNQLERAYDLALEYTRNQEMNVPDSAVLSRKLSDQIWDKRSPVASKGSAGLVGSNVFVSGDSDVTMTPPTNMELLAHLKTALASVVMQNSELQGLLSENIEERSEARRSLMLASREIGEFEHLEGLDMVIFHNKLLGSDALITLLDAPCISTQHLAPEFSRPLMSEPPTRKLSVGKNKIEPKAETTDPYVTDQWYVQRKTADRESANVARGWDFVDGGMAEKRGLVTCDPSSATCRDEGFNEVRVAVLDSGCNMHMDMGYKMFWNHEKCGHAQLDEAGLPRIPSCSGVNFAQAATWYDDQVGHGTAVAGIIAAKRNNLYGIAGICDGCRVQCIKITDRNGISTTPILRGLDYLITHKIKISNHSYGGIGDSPSEQAGFYRLSKEDHLFIIAAGNSGCNIDSVRGKDACLTPDGRGGVFFPAKAKISNKIVVGSSDESGVITDFSNFGPTVDIFAPGVDILSLAGRHFVTHFDGTSFSTPIVTATAAAVWSLDPSLTASQVKHRVLDSAYAARVTGKNNKNDRIVDFKAALAAETSQTNTTEYRSFLDRLNPVTPVARANSGTKLYQSISEILAIYNLNNHP